VSAQISVTSMSITIRFAQRRPPIDLALSRPAEKWTIYAG
jgi:hypothetical protein